VVLISMKPKRKLRKAAQEAIANRGSELEYAKAQAELASAVAQLASLRRLRRK